MPALDLVQDVRLKKFLMIEFGIAAVANAVMGGGMVYVIFGGMPTVPLFQGTDGVAFDLVMMSFLVGVLMTVTLWPMLRKRMARGTAPTLSWHDLPNSLAWFPRNLIVRGVLVGLISLVALVPITILLLMALQIETIAFMPLVAFKAAYGAVLGVFVAPMAILPSIAK